MISTPFAFQSAFYTMSMQLPTLKEEFATDIVNHGVDGGNAASTFYVSVKVKRRMPDFLSIVNLKYVKLGYSYLISHASCYFGFVVPLVIAVLLGVKLRNQNQNQIFFTSYDFADVSFLMVTVGFVLYFCVGLLTPSRSTYLLDFACYRPPNELKVSKKEFIDLASKSGEFSDAAIEFQKRVLNNSGIGDETYMPSSVFKPEYKITLRDGREEAAMTMFGAIDDLFTQTKIRPKDIKILVVNCGVLNTTPSLSSMVVNHYKMRNDIQSFNLGGMGCAAGIIAIDLANDLLNAYPSSYAIVVSTEAVSYTWYKGNDFDMLLPNCFFRMGASALLLSNRHRDRWRAKYELKQLVRIHKGMDDRSFKCIRQREDTRGRQGISVSSDLLDIAKQALKDNITSLAPLLIQSAVFNKMKMLKRPSSSGKNCKIKLCKIINGGSHAANSGRSDHHHPDDNDNNNNENQLAFEHVCIMAASKKALDETKKNLGITEEYYMEASRKTLERFGNTSSSSLWYEMGYLEAQGRIKRSDSILQIAFGSGFKCNSVVFKALRTPNKPHLSPWA